MSARASCLKNAEKSRETNSNKIYRTATRLACNPGGTTNESAARAKVVFIRQMANGGSSGCQASKKPGYAEKALIAAV